MSHHSTGGEEETKFLIEIWSDNNIKSQLEEMYNNADTFYMGEQCFLK